MNSDNERYCSAEKMDASDSEDMLSDSVTAANDQAQPVTKKLDSHSGKMMRSLALLKSDDSFCDVTIMSGNLHIRAHRNVLASATDYFKTMFMNDTKEAKIGIVDFTEVPRAVVKQCIDFIYSSQAQITMETAKNLLDASKLMQLPGLSKLCVEFLAERVDMKSCAEVITLSNLYKKDALNSPIEQFLFGNFKEFALSDDFLSLNYDSIMYCLELVERDDKNRELEKWNSIVRWTNHDVEERRCHFSKLFNTIDIACFTRSFIEKTIYAESLVFDSKDCLQYIAKVMLDENNPCENRKNRNTLNSIVAYNRESKLIHQYNVKAEKWSILTRFPCQFPTNLDMILHNGALYISDGFILHIYSNGSWTTTRGDIIPVVFKVKEESKESSTSMSCKMETSQNYKPPINESPSNSFQIPVVSSGVEGKASLTTTGSFISPSTITNSAGLFGATNPSVFGAKMFSGLQNSASNARGSIFQSPSTIACTSKSETRLGSMPFGKLTSGFGQATPSPSESQGFSFGSKGATLQLPSAFASNAPTATSETRSGSAPFGKSSRFGKSMPSANETKGFSVNTVRSTTSSTNTTKGFQFPTSAVSAKGNSSVLSKTPFEFNFEKQTTASSTSIFAAPPTSTAFGTFHTAKKSNKASLVKQDLSVSSCQTSSTSINSAATNTMLTTSNKNSQYNRCFAVKDEIFMVTSTSLSKYHLKSSKWHRQVLFNGLGEGFFVAVSPLKIYFMGGKGSEKRVREFDLSSSRFEILSSMSVPKSRGHAFWFDERVYAFGGEYPAVVECYDPEMDRWCLLPDLKIARCPAKVFVGDELFLIGGEAESDFGRGDAESEFDSIELGKLKPPTRKRRANVDMSSYSPSPF